MYRLYCLSPATCTSAAGNDRRMFARDSSGIDLKLDRFHSTNAKRDLHDLAFQSADYHPSGRYSSQGTSGIVFWNNLRAHRFVLPPKSRIKAYVRAGPLPKFGCKNIASLTAHLAEIRLPYFGTKLRQSVGSCSRVRSTVYMRGKYLVRDPIGWFFSFCRLRTMKGR